ncbi:MAG: cob(I)alamin adenosyltransferase [Clostridiales bacterium]|nr:cob(I)alamin adenosyltransferase [Clostridiales bacterium]
MIHVYHGTGKGKTTAAIGLTIRAQGAGRNIVFSQFLKGRDTSEIAVLASLPRVMVLRNQEDYGFLFQMTNEQKEAVTKLHNERLDEIIALIREKTVDFIVMDEITYPYNEGLLDRQKLESLIEGLDPFVELVLTGRNPSPYFLSKADYITNMQCERHPFESGQAARPGIEF